MPLELRSLVSLQIILTSQRMGAFIVIKIRKAHFLRLLNLLIELVKRPLHQRTSYLGEPVVSQI